MSNSVLCCCLLLYLALCTINAGQLTRLVLLQEFNHDKETVRSLQIWMTPDRRGHTPQYGSSKYTREDRHNKLLLILGGSKAAPSWEGVAPGKGINLHQVCPFALANWCTNPLSQA